MRNVIVVAVVCFFTLNAFGQDSIPPTSIVEANFITEPQEPSYGVQVGYQHKISNANNRYAFYAGAFESFLRTNEDVADEGTTGQTVENGVGGLITGELRFLQERNLFFNVSIHSGWGYRKTSVNLSYTLYDIDRNYVEEYHYLKLGVDSRVGYRWKNTWGIQFIARYDFSRIVDKYRNILGEKPGFIYGFGMTYNWNGN